MIDGRKRFKGRLQGIRDDNVLIAGDWGEAAVPLAAIVRAKLVLTDELIAAELEKRNR
jgi:ribosome maturation factor RimP